ncbi:hypothetical protein [Castellaniella sp.]|uniref:hypothetical protein n=1 Tax=Castellaniella sp. TaxID=1955812 RepID=UPI003A91A02F
MMNERILNGRTLSTTAWRLHSYAKRAGSITCLVIRPDGAYINESLVDFAKQADGREWDNDPEDIQAMLRLATTKEMRHG